MVKVWLAMGGGDLGLESASPAFISQPSLHRCPGPSSTAFPTQF